MKEALSTDERVELRKRQAHKVMPIIGSLLDAWENLPNDVSGLQELRQIRQYIQRIEAAMENA